MTPETSENCVMTRLCFAYYLVSKNWCGVKFDLEPSRKLLKAMVPPELRTAWARHMPELVKQVYFSNCQNSGCSQQIKFRCSIFLGITSAWNSCKQFHIKRGCFLWPNVKFCYRRVWLLFCTLRPNVHFNAQTGVWKLFAVNGQMFFLWNTVSVYITK